MHGQDYLQLQRQHVSNTHCKLVKIGRVVSGLKFLIIMHYQPV